MNKSCLKHVNDLRKRVLYNQLHTSNEVATQIIILPCTIRNWLKGGFSKGIPRQKHVSVRHDIIQSDASSFKVAYTKRY